MSPYYADGDVTLYHGDCLDVLRGLPAASVDAVVTDPPYGLAFMGKAWDDHVDGARFGAWCQQWSAECLRVLKPGGHMVAFGGSRTWHRLAVAVEDAGFEIRDSIAWLYGSGFPKSLDVSKAIDKAAGAEREVVGTSKSPFRMADPKMGDAYMSTQTGDTRKTDANGYIIRETTAPATDDAKAWQGWGTALKPAFEPIVVGRKPLVGTVAANVLAHGTGALNIDACRVAAQGKPLILSKSEPSAGILGDGLNGSSSAGTTDAGRWPSNVVLDDSQAAELDKQSGTLTSGKMMPTRTTAGTGGRPSAYGADAAGGFTTMETYGDSGGASRFFPTFRYEAKAPTAERPRDGAVAHPTVKPLDLMRWLVRLVTPPGGLVLEPFAGSGTTAEACILEGFRCIAVEREAAYLPLILARITKELEPSLGLDFGGG